MGATKEKKPLINKSLISLKIILFLVFGGLACIHGLNSIQPEALGLNFNEYRIISIVVPLVSLIGPLIAGPLADKLASRNANTFGRSIRILTAIFLILASIFYGCLSFIPKVQRFEARRPLVTFGCDADGAIIFQERCTEERTCFHWKKEKTGSLTLTNCTYTCQNETKFESLYNPWVKGSPQTPTVLSSESDYDYDGTSSPTPFTERIKRSINFYDDTSESMGEDERIKRAANSSFQKTGIPPQIFVEPPHLCMKKKENGIERVDRCHVYTSDTKSLRVDSILRSATNKENDTHSAEWCHYPLDGFQCTVPEQQSKWMIHYRNNSKCKPLVECEVENPYAASSVLAESQCIQMIGDIDTTWYGYIFLRIIAEIFPLGALTLLNTAIIVATRETSTGRGEVCRQYVWGVLGWIFCIPHLDLLNQKAISLSDYSLALTILAIILFVLAAIILVFASGLPLSPPEWWWHTKTGMLVYPMSAIRKYGPEMVALTLIALVLGIFWSSIHSFLMYTHSDYYGLTSLAIIPILLLLFNVDKFIEYCGHSNIFIGAFAIYIIRFTALTMVDDCVWLTIILETVEPLVIGVTWIAIMLYMRHIVPRRFTATGQAVAVIAHFCLGKCFGALIGLSTDKLHYIYNGLAITACIISLIYFTLYHLLLAPKCAAKSQPPPPAQNLSQQSNNGATNTNGSYTPLRVYHNERGKKGQFRY